VKERWREGWERKTEQIEEGAETLTLPKNREGSGTRKHEPLEKAAPPARLDETSQTETTDVEKGWATHLAHAPLRPLTGGGPSG